MMNSDLANLWSDYLSWEKRKARRETMRALDRFIDRLLHEPEIVWHSWARDTAASISDFEAKIPVRFPLLQRVLAPALAQGVLRGEPGYARWLARVGESLFNVRDSALPPQLRTVTGLLEEAIRIDPTDKLALKRLVDRRASYLDFTLHELPTGVLYDMDGASVDQCKELLEYLAEFKMYVAATFQNERFSDLIRDCEFHYRNYADYLRLGSLPGGYKQYLERHGG